MYLCEFWLSSTQYQSSSYCLKYFLCYFLPLPLCKFKVAFDTQRKPASEVFKTMNETWVTSVLNRLTRPSVTWITSTSIPMSNPIILKIWKLGLTFRRNQTNPIDQTTLPNPQPNYPWERPRIRIAQNWPITSYRGHTQNWVKIPFLVRYVHASWHIQLRRTRRARQFIFRV